MSTTFQTIPGFCPDCGSILPPLKERGGVACYKCSRQFLGDLSDVYGNTSVKYTIHFNSRDTKTKIKTKQENQEEGSVVERKCPQCGNEKMSYATLQLRSADEGQTVFYTCIKCNFKESENS